MSTAQSAKLTGTTSPPNRMIGLCLSLALAGVAALLGTWVPLVGGPVFGIALGMLVRGTGKVPDSAKPGIAFASKQVLQLSIVLLGAGLSLGQVWQTGRTSLVVMLSTLTLCLVCAWLFGRLLGVSGDLTTLVGVGTAICGASAIAAVSPVIEAKERDLAYSVSTIFAYNVAAVLLFPLLGHLMALSQHAFGLWAGTAINDTSSVVAAAYSYGNQAGVYATVVKLTRSTLIIPVALGIAAVRTVQARRAGSAATKVSVARIFPWFLLGFLAMALLHSVGLLPAATVSPLTSLGKFLIVVALTAVGLNANFKQMAQTGGKPLLLGLILWAVVAVTSLVAQHLTGQLM